MTPPNDSANENPKSRRGHRKSRNGCMTCKSRHIKCDEARPSCHHCASSGRRCIYHLNSTSSSSPLRTPTRTTIRAPTRPSDRNLNREVPATILDHTQCMQLATTPQDAAVFTLHHFSLFHHAQSGMPTVCMTEGETIQITLQHALTTPYLMNQLPAVSALHTERNDAHQSRHDLHSVTLQTRALTLFNAAKEAVSDTNCIPVFIFSSLLGVQLLHETLRNRPDSFGLFLDKFMAYFHLHRGVIAVLSKSWCVIRESPLQRKITKIEDAMAGEDEICSKIEKLCAMLDEADLTLNSRTIYDGALSTLRRTFGIYRNLQADGSQPYDAAIAFTLTVSKEYLVLLEQRRPDALVILSFYAVMLHWGRDFWIFNDGGQYMVKAITAHLSPHWTQWLEWPNSVVDAAMNLGT